MKHLSSILISAVFIAGCSVEKSDAWNTASIGVEDIESMTLVCWTLTLDGGTSTVYAITNDGYKCTVRLNQHALPGDYPLNEDDSPGRLFFNDSLIAVRSEEEKRLIDLLRDASFALIDVEDLRILAGSSAINPATLESLAIDDEKHLLEGTRDKMVAFVSSDAYVEIAHNGLP